eukprot:4730536-Pleurochrysis_carterae.AAC.1
MSVIPARPSPPRRKHVGAVFNRDHVQIAQIVIKCLRLSPCSFPTLWRKGRFAERAGPVFSAVDNKPLWENGNFEEAIYGRIQYSLLAIILHYFPRRAAVVIAPPDVVLFIWYGINSFCEDVSPRGPEAPIYYCELILGTRFLPTYWYPVYPIPRILASSEELNVQTK